MSLTVLLITLLPTSPRLISPDKHCTMLTDTPRSVYYTAFKSLVYLLFMILPLIFNLSAYSLIIMYLQRHPRLRYLSPRLILIKAVLINITFTASWLPYVTTCEMIRLSDHVIMSVTRVMLYLHCLTNPLLYAFSSVAIKSCLRWTDKARSVRVSNIVKRNLSRSCASKTPTSRTF